MAPAADMDRSMPMKVFPVAMKNTFLEVPRPPPLLQLERAATDPLRQPPGLVDEMDPMWYENPDDNKDSCWVADAASTAPSTTPETTPNALPTSPPPPLLELERFETYDQFESPSRTAVCLADSLAHPPPFLELERFETYDHFDSPSRTALPQLELLPTCGLHDGLGCAPAPLPLGLERYETYDPFESAPSPALLAPPPVGVAGPGAVGCEAHLPKDARPAPRMPPPPLQAPARVPPPPLQAPAPTFAPGEARAASGSEPSPEEGRGRPGLTQLDAGGVTWLRWTVDARRLESQDKVAVSPEFTIDLPGLGARAFRMALNPRVVNDKKRGAGFKKAKGRGTVTLKCCEELPAGAPCVAFSVRVGAGDTAQPTRGPTVHDFAEQTCGGLTGCKDEWNFSNSIDESGTFLISVEVAPVPASMKH